MMEQQRTTPSAAIRVALALVLPPLGAILLATLIGFLSGNPDLIAPGEAAWTALLFAGSGGIAWLLGINWYDLRSLGLRGGRPLYAGIAFATFGWIAFFAIRLITVASDGTVIVSPQFGRAFIYFLVFEGLATQLWLFGLFFRSLVAWRGPLTAAISSGIVFGAVAFLLFDEAYSNSLSAILYFVVWGVFYAIIRLRTGSFLGPAIVQAIQSVTTWYILLPEAQPDLGQLQNLYLYAGIVYVILIWRLWPRREEDYRV
jgi:hypothetical protein